MFFPYVCSLCRLFILSLPKKTLKAVHPHLVNTHTQRKFLKCMHSFAQSWFFILWIEGVNSEQRSVAHAQLCGSLWGFNQDVFICHILLNVCAAVSSQKPGMCNTSYQYYDMSSGFQFMLVRMCTLVD